MMSMPNDARLDDLVEAIKTLLASQGRIYMHFAEATIERFGREGEMTVRLGLRARGDAMSRLELGNPGGPDG